MKVTHGKSRTIPDPPRLPVRQHRIAADVMAAIKVALAKVPK